MPQNRRKRTRSIDRLVRPLKTRQWMLLVAVTCQLATIGITWRVWTVRDQPMNLPLLPLPTVPFLIPMLFTAVLVLVRPRVGVILHAFVYFIAVVMDQYRLQPQFFSLIVLMSACCFDHGPWFARWYLATMWIWTGTHKLLSAEWLGVESWSFLKNCGANFDGSTSFYLAIAIGTSEILLGVLAVVKPKIAAVLCVAIHSSILLSLSPWMANHNESVWFWNVATAVIGAWLLLQDEVRVPHTLFRFAIVALLLIVPAGFYLGVVNSRLAFVLYSGNLPRALHVGQDTLARLDGWTGLTVPFPNSPRLFVQVFEREAEPGEKLHVADPRRWLPDRFFLKQADGTACEITRDGFYGSDPSAGEIRGIELDSRNAVWHLVMAGAELSYDENAMVESAAFKGPGFQDRPFRFVRQLPNLRLLEMNDTAVTDAGLQALGGLQRLEVVVIRGGPPTNECLPVFRELPALRELRLEKIGLTSDGLAALRDLRQLATLHLRCDKIDDQGLHHLGSLAELAWLDLSDTRVSGAGLTHLRLLERLDWLNLSRTALDDDGLQQLGNLTRLAIVELAGTKISDQGLVHLLRLDRCEVLDLAYTVISDDGLRMLAKMESLQTLKLRGTQVTSDGVQRLQAALVGCHIDW